MTDALKNLTDTLAVDGYTMVVERASDHAVVSVTSADGTCDDCLVPKTVMKGFLSAALELAEAEIDLFYPDEVASS